MKKSLIFITLLMLHAFLFADIACEDSDVCPDGMYCSPTAICALDPSERASYAEISVVLGKETPGLHADAFYLSVEDGKQVLGQFELSVQNPSETKKIYTEFKSIAIKQQRSSTNIAIENLELIYDKNGNGKVDGDDEVWSNDVTEDAMKLTFTIDDYHTALKTNNRYALLIVGSVVYSEITIPDNQMILLKLDDKSMIDIVARDSIAVVQPNVDFPKIILIPSGDVLLFTVGEHQSKAPAWESMTGFLPVLHIAMVSAAEDVEWSGFKINVANSSTKFGPSIPTLKIYDDKNNDGAGDSLLATITPIEGATSVLFEPKDAPITLKKGEYSYFVVEVDVQLFAGQYVKFVADSVDTDAKVLGSPVLSDVFKYDCTKDDDGCRLAPGEGGDAPDGCSIITVF